MRSFLVAFLGLLAGCGGIAGVCTEIGCATGLTVRLGAAPAGGYRVEAIVAGQEQRVHECAAGTTCEVLFEDFAPQQVTVRVTGGGAAREETFTPSYQVSYPNGPECGPECRNATVDFPPAA
ncbi:MAG TPA: hypothetical protein VFQ45_01245 [Longimicrobium sp.]|nr:hypothetical protein [Longimicrobium sp.]